MKNINRPSRHFLMISLFIVATVSFASCSALNEAQQRRQERVRERQQERHMMLERPKSEITASPDGLKIDSKHYSLNFADDLLKHKDYDEIKERQEMGQGALVFMESLYQYVHDIFGFEPPHKIQVVLYETYQGTNMMAQTVIQYQTISQGGELLKTTRGIQIHFPLAMYDRKGTRAHELTHAFTNIYLLPTWFAEGIAVLVQVEYAKDKSKYKVDLFDDLKVDLDGINAAQNWKGHYDFDQLTQWRYNYSYAIVSELKARFGEDFYPKLFRLIEEDRLHQKLLGEMNSSFLVYYLSKAAGQDLVPFFEDLKFQLRRLSREEILATLSQTSQ
jgi:hypothetical protein